MCGCMSVCAYVFFVSLSLSFYVCMYACTVPQAFASILSSCLTCEDPTLPSKEAQTTKSGKSKDSSPPFLNQLA